MKELATFDLAPEQRYLESITLPDYVNKLVIVVSHWEGEGALDMELEVSYDGGTTWLHGGGCKGAQSAPPEISFYLRYGSYITNLKGAFHSSSPIVSTVKILVED